MACVAPLAGHGTIHILISMIYMLHDCISALCSAMLCLFLDSPLNFEAFEFYFFLAPMV